MASENILSDMSGKLSGIQSINTNPLSNQYCERMSMDQSCICSKCYSVLMLKQYRRNMIPKLQYNSDLLSKSLLPASTLKRLTPIKSGTKVFRFHSHGELINVTHLRNFIAICDLYPDITFALWTKRSGLVYSVYEEIPDNVILVYSNPEINNPLKEMPKFDKVFNVVTMNYAENYNIKINCGAKKCSKCMQCYTKGGVSVINELLK